MKREGIDPRRIDSFDVLARHVVCGAKRTVFNGTFVARTDGPEETKTTINCVCAVLLFYEGEGTKAESESFRFRRDGAVLFVVARNVPFSFNHSSH